MMRAALITSLLMAAGCTSKPSRLLGPLPNDANELLGTMCAHANGGTLEADGDFKTAKIAFSETAFVPGLEAIKCVPKGPDPALNALVFDHETRRLYALRAVLRYGDLDTLEKLLLPALTESERAGFALEKMRLHAPWMGKATDHFWTDGHAYIWTHRTEGRDDSDNSWPPEPQTTFQIIVSTRK